jgi:flagellar hook assembly protein FlgD
MPKSARVRLEVYDALGRRVRTLEDGMLPPGRHTRSWDGTSSGGSAVGPGLFFIRLTAPGVQSILKAVRVR